MWKILPGIYYVGLFYVNYPFAKLHFLFLHLLRTFSCLYHKMGIFSRTFRQFTGEFITLTLHRRISYSPYE